MLLLESAACLFHSAKGRILLRGKIQQVLLANWGLKSIIYVIFYESVFLPTKFHLEWTSGEESRDPTQLYFFPFCTALNSWGYLLKKRLLFSHLLLCNLDVEHQLLMSLLVLPSQTTPFFFLLYLIQLAVVIWTTTARVAKQLLLQK